MTLEESPRAVHWIVTLSGGSVLAASRVGLSLDAIHLESALRIEADELLAYDAGLWRPPPTTGSESRALGRPSESLPRVG
jgi:hypothetical protein